ANATKKLEHTGFVVNKKLEKEFSLKVTKNEVIRTNPQAKKKFKKGKEITLIISKGKDQFKLKDYTGYDYSDATDELEKLGIEVNISKKQISDQLVASNKVIEQLPAAGKKIKVNSVVTLYIPEIVVVFPDFVSENWSVSQVKSFCSKHGITLTTGTEETDDYEVGTIISQTRAAGTNVASGSSIKIVIAAALPEVAKPTPIVPPKTDQKDPNA
ncbi:MAG: PASTA domain-containing protein, partial [Bacilli bacterium]